MHVKGQKILNLEEIADNPFIKLATAFFRKNYMQCYYPKAASVKKKVYIVKENITSRDFPFPSHSFYLFTTGQSPRVCLISAEV
jgi:aerobic-type carbon monoxide dehydrogenase small subunit (CoxS/CutS family)